MKKYIKPCAEISYVEKNDVIMTSNQNIEFGTGIDNGTFWD